MTISLILVYFAYLLFGLKRLLTYAHALQQDDYDNSRFLRWMTGNRVFDKKLSVALLIIAVFGFFLPVIITHALLFIAFLYVAYSEKDPRVRAKKKFILTRRVKRIIGVAFFFTALLGMWWFLLPFTLPWIACVQLMPLILALSNAILQPAENSIQKKYWMEANGKIAAQKPFVIGITGSFGKTSVKHILGHILKTQAPTLITPGSVNTAMGIARIIRERLEPQHKYFIVEMGAYGPGSIAKLCEMVPPDMGIITAIGAAHYERFKSLDTVTAAKFELAEAVQLKGGKVILPASLLNKTHAAALRDKNAGSFIVCGDAIDRPAGDLHMQSFEQTAQGLRLSLFENGTIIALQAPLYGLHHATNIMLAYAAARALGVSSEDIATALRSMPQIQHRLEVKPQGDGSTLIDDAFNSNPDGFAAALDLMPVLSGAEGRKILITPGMVELGNEHDRAHEAIGLQAGRICDIAIIVQARRIDSFIRGFRQTGADKTIIEVDSFQEAARWLQRNTQGGDVILIENDLPDLYESVPRL